CGHIWQCCDPAYALRVRDVGHLDDAGVDRRQIGGDGHATVEKARVIQQPLGAEYALLVQGPADALDDAALDLPLHIARVDRPSGVLDRRVAYDLNFTRLRIDLDIANLRR